VTQSHGSSFFSGQPGCRRRFSGLLQAFLAYDLRNAHFGTGVGVFFVDLIKYSKGRYWNGASLRNFAVISGLSPGSSGTVPRVYEPRRTAVVCTAKAWDSPHAGTVPVLLEISLN